MELKCQLVIRMACNSGFAFTDEKGTLTKIAFGPSLASALTGSSSVGSTGLCSAPTPPSRCGEGGLHPLSFPQRARQRGRRTGRIRAQQTTPATEMEERNPPQPPSLRFCFFPSNRNSKSGGCLKRFGFQRIYDLWLSWD